MQGMSERPCCTNRVKDSFVNPVWKLGGMIRPTPPAYKTRNWPSYNGALKRRGSLTIWSDPAMSWEAAPTGKRGRQPACSDAAIQTCLTMKVLFGMVDIDAPSAVTLAISWSGGIWSRSAGSMPRRFARTGGAYRLDVDQQVQGPL